MKLYKPKERVEAEQQKEDFTALSVNGEKQEFVSGDYLVKRDKLVFGMDKEEFEAKYEPSKLVKAKEASTATKKKKAGAWQAQGQGG